MPSFPARGVPQLIQILDSIVEFCCENAQRCKQDHPNEWPDALLITIGKKVKKRHGVRLQNSTIIKHLVEKRPMVFMFQGWQEWCEKALVVLEKEEDKKWNKWYENRKRSWKGGPVPELCPVDQIRIGGRKAKTLEELQQAWKPPKP